MVRFALQGLGKRFSYGPACLEPPAGARIRKKSKIREGRGVICAPRAIRESTDISYTIH